MTGSVTFKHQYNAAGNTTLAYMTLDNGGSSVNDLFTAYTYDSQTRLSTVVDNNLPTGANTTTYLYDLVGNPGVCPSNGRDCDGPEMTRMRDGAASRLWQR